MTKFFGKARAVNINNQNDLILPKNYNPETHLLKNETENGTFHESRKAASFAASLVANGTANDLELAEKILGILLNCQEREPNEPHFGNFYWMVEDSVVQDLNAVEFCLEHLIPMMLLHSDRLSVGTHQRVMEAIYLALLEVEKLDVLVAYTNICLLDFVNTCLGGELLKNEKIMARGRQKLKDWMTFTDNNGTAFEHNSPTYTNVCIKALKRLAEFSTDEETKIRARTASARLGLSAALHIHSSTKRWAGPHSRAYHPSILCETPPELELVQGWLADGALPSWVGDALEPSIKSFEITETASRQREIGLTTYQTPEFALGVSTKEYSGQSNVLMLHYDSPKTEIPGVLYTRYLTNEKWLGDFYHATDRTKSRNIIDEGQFYGVQKGNKTIGCYTLAQSAVIHSAKLCFILLGADKVEEVWLDGQQLAEKSFETSGDELVVLTSGEVYIAIKPLSRRQLGRGMPVKLVEREGDLVLELYNYSGKAKSFWELNWPHFFYKGKAQCSFYMEVASRQDYANAGEFAQTILSGSFEQTLDDAQTFSGEGERLLTTSYERDGEALGLEIDLMQWQLKRRWTQKGDIGWPMLESPIARQNTTGVIECNGARLECKPESAWLYSNPESDLYVVGYHGSEPSSLRLKLPSSVVNISSMGLGTVVWQKGELSIDSLSLGDVKIIEKGEA